MKKTLYILLLTIAASVSCDKLSLDKKSLDSMPGEFVRTTQEGLQMLMSGVYNDLQSSGYYGGVLYLYEASHSPDFFVRNVGGGYSFRLENRYETGTRTNGNARNLWLRCYNVIRNCTIIIESVDDVDGDIEVLRRIKGEAYALRGLAYFDLLRVFAYPPKFSCTWGSSYIIPPDDPANYDPDALPIVQNTEYYCWGVPLVNTMDEGYNVLDHKIYRATADECWNFVLDQFDRAYSLLNGRTTAAGHINAPAVLALKQRTALYMEDSKSVIELGLLWLNRYEANYKMIPYDTYPKQYWVSGNSEKIWEIVYSETDNLDSSSINYWARKQTYDEDPSSPDDGKLKANIGYAKMGLTFGHANMAIEQLTKYPNDIRQHLICDLGVPGTGYKALRKYVGTPYHFVHNIPVVRLPEIYLNMAEAYMQRANTAMAAEYLSKVTEVRRKASVTPQTVNDVLDERRREFMFEGQNYFDYFRNGRSITGRQIIESISSTSSITFGKGETYRAVYPIPLAEMNANPAIRNQQNPKYGAWYLAIEEED